MNTKRNTVMADRVTVRIPRQMRRELDGLGRFEKRRVPDMVRQCLSQALASFRAAHPGKSPVKPRNV